MFNEVSYLGATWQDQGFSSKASWKQAGKPGAIDKPAPTPDQTLTIPTTEPNQCPPGMTYAAPPPGSGTGTCTGPMQVSGGPLGSISDIFGGIDPTYLLIGGAILLFVLFKKR